MPVTLKNPPRSSIAWSVGVQKSRQVFGGLGGVRARRVIRTATMSSRGGRLPCHALETAGSENRRRSALPSELWYPPGRDREVWL